MIIKSNNKALVAKITSIINRNMNEASNNNISTTATSTATVDDGRNDGNDSNDSNNER